MSTWQKPDGKEDETASQEQYGLQARSMNLTEFVNMLRYPLVHTHHACGFVTKPFRMFFHPCAAAAPCIYLMLRAHCLPAMLGIHLPYQRHGVLPVTTLTLR